MTLSLDYDSTWKLLTGQDMVIDIIEDIFHIVIIFQNNKIFDVKILLLPFSLLINVWS